MLLKLYNRVYFLESITSQGQKEDQLIRSAKEAAARIFDDG